MAIMKMTHCSFASTHFFEVLSRLEHFLAQSRDSRSTKTYQAEHPFLYQFHGSFFKLLYSSKNIERTQSLTRDYSFSRTRRVSFLSRKIFRLKTINLNTGTIYGK